VTARTTGWLVGSYRAIITAYPPAFRVTFGDSMAADFSDAVADAGRWGRRRDLAVLLARVAMDLAWSISSQWLRTSVPWLTAAYAIAILGIVEGLASALVGGRFTWAVIAAFVPPVALFTFTMWFLLPHLRRNRSTPPCLTFRA
jgi:hypothetical protein